MGDYFIQLFSGGWIVRDKTGKILVKCPTYEEAKEWTDEQEERDEMKHF